MATPLIFGSLRAYKPAWLRKDLIAGMTVWAVLVPESLAYATIAGVPPVVGLYAAIPALVLYPLFGTSRHLIVGPMSTTAAVSAGIIASHAPAGSQQYVALSAALALVTGVLALGAGLLKLGFLAGFISEPVLKGFIIGLALTIIAGQLPKLFGVSKGEGNFFEQLWHLITNLDKTNGWTLVLGVLSLALVLGLRRFLPLVPGALLAVACGVIAVAVFGLQNKDVDLVGHIDAGLPTFGLPSGLGLDDYLGLAGPAAAIVLVAFAEGLGAAKAFAARDHYTVDPNRELIGLSSSNLGAGLSSGMVVNGSLSKTAVNGGAGARSQLSGLTVAALTVLTLLFLTGLFEKLPEATLGAVVVAAVIELANPAPLWSLHKLWTRHLREIYGLVARVDFIAGVAALAGVLLFDTLPGLFIGIAVSTVLLLYRASRPHIAALGKSPVEENFWVDRQRHSDAQGTPEAVVLRIEGGLFFANADQVADSVRRAAHETNAHIVVLDVETVPFIDVTASRMLSALHDDMDREGVRLALARDVGQVRDVLRSAGEDTLMSHVYSDIDSALDGERSSPSTGEEIAPSEENPRS